MATLYIMDLIEDFTKYDYRFYFMTKDGLGG
jgi:hypothetical protein